jgi:hypothetical protein
MFALRMPPDHACLLVVDGEDRPLLSTLRISPIISTGT